ncbi:YkgJ family cysteine cluster protein [Streptomyces sp. NPDC005047]
MELDDAMAVVVALAGGPVRETNPKALDELYRSLPTVQCIGECWSSCAGNIQLSPLEKSRVNSAGLLWKDGGFAELPNGTRVATPCSALDQTRLVCRVYKDRPMICRIWGIFESMACPWGCRPKGGLLDDIEAMRLMNLALWYGGSASAIEPSRWDEISSTPRYRAALKEMLAQGRPVRDSGEIIQGTIRLRPGL